MAHDTENGRIKEVRVPPLLFSTRLTFFIVCLFASFNVILQRLNINFGLVCMVKSPSHLLPNQSFILDSELINETSILLERNVTAALNLEVELNSSDNPEANADYYESCIKPSASNDDNETTTPFVEGEFEWNKHQQGNILASFYYGYLFTQVLGGWVSDRFAGKHLFTLSMLVMSLLTLLNPIAAMQGPEYLFIVRMLQGLSQGASMPLINVLSARWSGHTERAFLISVAYGGFTVAAFVTNPLASLICQTAGWSYIFYITGALGLSWCVFAHLLVFDWPEDHPRISTEELDYLQKNRAVQPGTKQSRKVVVPWMKIFLSGPVNTVHLVHFCTLWGFSTLTMYIPTYLKEVLHMDIRKNGLLSSVPFLGMFFLHLVVGTVYDAMRRRGFCTITNLRKIFNTVGLLPVALSYFAMHFIPCEDNTAPIVFIFIFQSFGELALMGGYFFSIFEIAPRFSGVFTGITNTYGVLTGFLCPLLVSYLTPTGSRQEWLIVFYISGGIVGFGAVIYILFGSSELQSWAKPPEPILPKVQEMQVLQQKLINQNGEDEKENSS